MHALALTVHHSPGVQAMLLGSGISRPAGIPTGWEITLDLIRRLASVQGVADESDWASWYRTRYSKEPSYSEILDAVASTPAERRSIIHGYIEARDGEDNRQPTKAHNAIARLVALGAVRVIVTTNFDRLLESALREAGVEPTVIASDDALAGATPLVHSRCTVIKLHGDYMDARIKNTEDELERYSPTMDELLDRVLDEYGLIIAGWSGDWDAALRNAVLRSGSRRYPFYWAARGSLSARGRDLLVHRGGREISIADADSFFAELLSKVEALGAMERAHPESIALTVAEGKRFCRDERFAPDWSDLLAREVERFSSYIGGADYPRVQPTKPLVNTLVNTIIARSEALRRLVLVGVRWGNEETFRTTLRAIEALSFPNMDRAGFTLLVSLRQLAASLCFHWAVSAALLREDYVRVHRIMHLMIRAPNRGNLPAVSTLALAALESVDWQVLDGHERYYAPHSVYFSRVFLADARDIVIGKDEAERVWDDAEFMIAMETGVERLPLVKEKRLWFWVPVGHFVWRRQGDLMKDRLDRVRTLTSESPELRAGLLGGSPESAKEVADNVSAFYEEVTRGRL